MIALSHHQRSTLAQFCATFINSLSFVSLGLLVGMPAVVIENTHNAKEDLSLDSEQVSWYASLLPIFHPFGSFLGGVSQDYVGRKHGLLLVNILITITWFLLHTAANVETLYASSILLGMSLGFSEAPGLTYVCEIATPRLRGILVAYNVSIGTSGVTLTFLLATLIGWRTSCLICMGFCALSVLLLLLIPDSPTWLIINGRRDDALKAIRWLRGWTTEVNVKDEFAELCRAIENSSKQFDREPNDSFWKSKLKIDQLLHKSSLRPFIFIQLYMFFCCAAGLMGARNYFLIIFDRLNLPINSTWLGFAVSLASLCGKIICSILVSVIGKRPLSLATIFLCSSLALLMGLYVSFQHVLNQPWIFISLVICLGCSACAGILTLPWILLGEIYPVKIRSVAAGLTGASYYIIISVFVKTYFYLEQLMGVQGIFMLYSAIGFIGFFYMWFYMPETEGKTIAEIEELFSDDARKLCAHFRKKK